MMYLGERRNVKVSLSVHDLRDKLVESLTKTLANQGISGAINAAFVFTSFGYKKKIRFESIAARF